MDPSGRSWIANKTHKRLAKTDSGSWRLGRTHLSTKSTSSTVAGNVGTARCGPATESSHKIQTMKLATLLLSCAVLSVAQEANELPNTPVRVAVRCDGVDLDELPVPLRVLVGNAVERTYNAVHGSADEDNSHLEGIARETPNLVGSWFRKKHKKDKEPKEPETKKEPGFLAWQASWGCTICPVDGDHSIWENELTVALLKTSHPAFEELKSCSINLDALATPAKEHRPNIDMDVHCKGVPDFDKLPVPAGTFVAHALERSYNLVHQDVSEDDSNLSKVVFRKKTLIPVPPSLSSAQNDSVNVVEDNSDIEEPLVEENEDSAPDDESLDASSDEHDIAEDLDSGVFYRDQLEEIRDQLDEEDLEFLNDLENWDEPNQSGRRRLRVHGRVWYFDRIRHWFNIPIPKPTQPPTLEPTWRNQKWDWHNPWKPSNWKYNYPDIPNFYYGDWSCYHCDMWSDDWWQRRDRTPHVLTTASNSFLLPAWEVELVNLLRESGFQRFSDVDSCSIAVYPHEEPIMETA